jgi:N-glycosidase YbiA
MVTINFYETSMPYGCFSNFSRHAIEVDGRTWATAEHFFQASKFTDHVDVEAIRNAQAPFIAARRGLRVN